MMLLLLLMLFLLLMLPFMIALLLYCVVLCWVGLCYCFCLITPYMYNSIIKFSLRLYLFTASEVFVVT